HGNTTFQGINPANDEKLNPRYMEATKAEVDQAVEKAEEAFKVYRRKSGAQRAGLLGAIADEIMELGDGLIDRASRETGLGKGRLTGERGRTVGQLRLFGEVLREGSWVGARIDGPKDGPDVRSMKIA